MTQRPTPSTSPWSAWARSAACWPRCSAGGPSRWWSSNATPSRYPLPRAVHFDHEVARILQACGLGRRAAPRSPSRADEYEWRNGSGQVLLRFGGRSRSGHRAGPTSNMFWQPALEAPDRAGRHHPTDGRGASRLAARTSSRSSTPSADRVDAPRWSGARRREVRPTGGPRRSGPLRGRLRRGQQHRARPDRRGRSPISASSTTG